MTAAAAAKKWWAAYRQRSPVSPPERNPGASSSVALLTLYLPLAVACALLLCAASGFAVGRMAEARVEARQRAALHHALDEFHARFAKLDAPDDVQLRTIARRSGLGDLRFESSPIGENGRIVQSLHDGRGRIVGWLSWSADRGLLHTLDRWWALLAATGAALGLCAVVMLRASRPLWRSFDRSAETVGKHTREDPVTGLPSQRVMLQHLEDALAKRRSGFVALALIDLDGFREVNDTLGRAGGDAVLASIAEHLKAGLLPGALLGRFEEDQFAVIVAREDRRAVDLLIESLRPPLLRPIFMDRMWQLTA